MIEKLRNQWDSLFDLTSLKESSKYEKMYTNLKKMVDLQIFIDTANYCKISADKGIRPFFIKNENDYNDINKNWEKFIELVKPQDKSIKINEKITFWSSDIFRGFKLKGILTAISIFCALALFVSYLFVLFQFITNLDLMQFYFIVLVFSAISFFSYFFFIQIYLKKDPIGYNLKSARINNIFLILQIIIIFVAWLDLNSFQFFISSSSIIEFNNWFEAGGIFLFLSLVWVFYALFLKTMELSVYSLLLIILLKLNALGKFYSEDYKEFPIQKLNFYYFREGKKMLKSLTYTLSRLFKKLYGIVISNAKEVNRLLIKDFIKDKHKTFGEMSKLLSLKLENKLKEAMYKDEKETKYIFSLIFDEIIKHALFNSVKIREVSIGSIIRNNSELVTTLIGLFLPRLIDLVF